MGRIREIVVDCDKPSVLARFWAALLDGYAVRAYDDAEIARLAALGFTPETDPTVLVDGPGPTLCFQRVEGRSYTANRMHLDITVTGRAETVSRHLALGASIKREAEGYTVMHDPEGNQYCVVGD